MLKTIIFSMFILVIADVSNAATDFTCLNDCTQKGYMYNYCQERCSYNANPNQQQQNQQQQQLIPNQIKPVPISRIDFKCLNDCTSKGYMYNYCKEQCTY